MNLNMGSLINPNLVKELCLILDDISHILSSALADKNIDNKSRTELTKAKQILNETFLFFGYYVDMGEQYQSNFSRLISHLEHCSLSATIFEQLRYRTLLRKDSDKTL